MASPIMPQELGGALIDALGLPEHCTSFTLRLQVDKPVAVECSYYPALDTKELVAALAEYSLVKREPAQEAPEHFDTWMRNRTDAAHQTFMDRTNGVFFRSRFTGRAWTKAEWDARKVAFSAALDAPNAGVPA